MNENLNFSKMKLFKEANEISEASQTRNYQIQSKNEIL